MRNRRGGEEGTKAVWIYIFVLGVLDGDGVRKALSPLLVPEPFLALLENLLFVFDSDGGINAQVQIQFFARVRQFHFRLRNKIVVHEHGHLCFFFSSSQQQQKKKKQKRECKAITVPAKS